MSFNEAMVHLGHAIAHSMGTVHHIPHDLGRGLGVPMALKYLSDTIPDKLRNIGNAMGLEQRDDLTNEELGKTGNNECCFYVFSLICIQTWQ